MSDTDLPLVEPRRDLPARDLPTVEPAADREDPPEMTERSYTVQSPQLRAGVFRSATETVIDKDIAGISRLVQTVKELRTLDEAYVSLFRVEPAFHPVTRRPIRGYKARFPVSEFRGAEDLLDRVEREYGGYKWDLRFSKSDNKESGTLNFIKSIRIEIDKEPVFHAADNGGMPTVVPGSNGQGSTVFAPAPVDVNADLVKGTLGILQKQIEDKDRDRDRSNAGRQDTLGLLKDIVQLTQQSGQGAAGATADLVRDTMRAAETRASDAQKEISDLRKMMMQPQQTPEAMRAVTETTALQVGTAHKEAAAAVERARVDYDREMRSLQERQDRERAFDKERFKVEVDRLNDQIQRAGDERARLIETHAADMRHARDTHRSETEAFTRRLDDERTQIDRMRANHEDRLKAEIAGVRGTFDATIAGLNERIKIAEQRSVDVERRWEEKARDLEKQRDQYMNQLMEERTRRPDPMSSVGGLAATAKELAGAFGYSRDSQQSAPARSEAADILVAIKEAGIIDAAKGIGSQIVGAVAASRATNAAAQGRAAPPYVISLPRDPVTGYPILPYAGGPSQQQPQISPPAYVQRPAQPSVGPVAYQQPAPGPFNPSSYVQPVQSAPQQATQQNMAQPESQPPQPPPGSSASSPIADQEELAILNIFVPALGQEMDAGKPARDVAKEILNVMPLGKVKGYVTGGVTKFMDKIEAIVPDSSLLTAKGEHFLRDVFSNIKAEMPR